MRRKQFYLDDDLDRELHALAARTGAPEAQHVRTALREYLNAHNDDGTRAEGAGALAGLVGLVDAPDGPDDAAEEHDHYLYGAPRRTG